MNYRLAAPDLGPVPALKLTFPTSARSQIASEAGAQVWSDIHAPGNDGSWLVANLDGVSTSSLHYWAA